MRSDPVFAWRYMDLRKFRNLLSSKALFFCPIRRFIDEYEGFIHHDLQEELFKLMAPIVGGEERVMWTVEHAKLHILDSCFVSCWTYWDSEQRQLWDEYVGDEPGVVLKTEVEKLHTTLSNAAPAQLICKPVRYSDYAEGEGSRLHTPAFRGELANLSPYAMLFFSKANYWIPDIVEQLEKYTFIFTKQPQFEYEREFRLVLATGHRVDFQGWRRHIEAVGVEYGTCGALSDFYINNHQEIAEIRRRPKPEGILVPFDFSILSEIHVGPSAPQSLVAEVRKEIDNHGLNVPIRVSDLTSK
jgi:hypothetical protein